MQIKFPENKFEKLTMRDINFLHGSNSASLPGIINSNNPGMKSLGEMMKIGEVPYSGELDVGSTGVSQNSISASDIDNKKLAQKYIDHDNDGWNPEKGEKKLAFLYRYATAIIDGEQAMREFAKRNKFMSQSHYNRGIEAKIVLNQIKIEKMRLKNWGRFNEFEQDLITNKFPVAYGIRYNDKSKIDRVFSGSKEEYIISDNIPLKDLIIFVPQDKMANIKRYIEERGIEVGNILPLEPVNR